MFQLAGKPGGLKKLGRRLCWEFFSCMKLEGLAFVGFGVKLVCLFFFFSPVWLTEARITRSLYSRMP